jgi:hypothetical protein
VPLLPIGTTAPGFQGEVVLPKHRPDAEGSMEAAFDLTRDYPPLTYPSKSGVDVGTVKLLLVEAAKCVADIREAMDDPSVIPLNLKFTKFNIVVFNLLEAAIEKGIDPIVAAPPLTQETSIPVVAKGERALREALEAAVMFEADLGLLPPANREKLGHPFSAGIRVSAIKKTEAGGKDPVEAIRLVADAVSCVTDIAFQGQATKKFENKFNKTDERIEKFCTMPIKQTFPDRSSCIYFEQVIRSECDLRAFMSLPEQVRVVQGDWWCGRSTPTPPCPFGRQAPAQGLHKEGWREDLETWRGNLQP